MEKEIAAADREILVETVKLVQRKGMRGNKGGWKGFLDCYDKKFGSSLSDPAKRPIDTLNAFLKTFTKEEDLEFVNKFIRWRMDRKRIEEFIRSSSDYKSPQQRLVRLTIEHPLYSKYYGAITPFDEDWVVTMLGKVSKAMKSNAMMAVDCEMVLCEDGSEAVVQICLVDQNLEVRLNEFVNPKKAVADYRTGITGLSAKDLEGVTCTLVDIQKSLKKLLSHGVILIGHSLHNDLRALKIIHARVIDTSFIFKYLDESAHSTPSLNSLCKAVLGHEVRRDGDPHNCQDDALSAMKLVLAKLEHGFDNPIDITKKDVVPETELGKLLIHGIPGGISCLELPNIFPKCYNVEVERKVGIQGQVYSIFALFKDPNAADEAFESLKGKVEKDVHGRVRKLISFQPSNGLTAKFYVGKMASDALLKERDLLKKRLGLDEAVEFKMPESKRQKLECNDVKEHQCKHVKEVERLKKELRQREEEVLNLQKILSALTRKHGL